MNTQTKVAELCEDRYGQLLQQLDILEYLADNKLPVDVSCSHSVTHLAMFLVCSSTDSSSPEVACASR